MSRVLGRGAAWMLYSYVAGFALQGLYFVLLARTLGPAEFGTYAGALAIATTGAAVAGLGAGNVLVMRASRDQGALRSALGAAWTYIVSGAPLLVGGALLFALPLGRDFGLTVACLACAELVFGKFSETAMQAFQSSDRLAVTANLNVAAGALRLALVVPFLTVVHPTAAQWAVLYLLASALLAATGSLLVLRRFGRPVLQSAVLRGTWRQGVPFALGMSSRVVYLDADKYLLNLLGHALAAGHFAAATRLLNMASAPIQAVVYSANASLFRAGAEGKHAVTPLLKRMLRFVVPYGVVSAVLIVLCSPLIPVVLGPGYAETAGLLVWLSPIVLLQGIHYAVGDALMGLGNQTVRSLVQVAVAFASVAANLLLIPVFGWTAVVGTALGSAGALALAMTLMYVLHGRSVAPDRSRTPAVEALA